MDSKKVKDFISLAGNRTFSDPAEAPPGIRKLAAQLILSEVLEYVIKGLGVTPSVNGTVISNPDSLEYSADLDPHKPEMIDGLADTAYTMYWNSVVFNLPLEKAFDIVCDNNLEKFVKLESWSGGERELEREEWHCRREVSWPDEVTTVSTVSISGSFYAVGKDSNGKVRKPSTYRNVDFSGIL